MSILSKLQRIFTPEAEKIRAHKLYSLLVEQARNPAFYEQYGITDSMEGRFELINLHMHLVLCALQRHFEKHPQAKELSRCLMEAYFADMDRNLREIGVGDSGIFYKIRKITSNFYGRLEAYGMAQENPSLWPEALCRNLFDKDTPPSTSHIQTFVLYITQSHHALSKRTYPELMAGDLEFGNL